jgi:hypothetical protein
MANAGIIHIIISYVVSNQNKDISTSKGDPCHFVRDRPFVAVVSGISVDEYSV